MSRLARIHYPPDEFWKISRNLTFSSQFKGKHANSHNTSMHIIQQHKISGSAPLTWFRLLKLD